MILSVRCLVMLALSVVAARGADEAATAVAIAFAQTRNDVVLFPGEMRTVMFHIPATTGREGQRWPIVHSATTCTCLSVDAQKEVAFDGTGAADVGVEYAAGSSPGESAGYCIVRCADVGGVLRDLRLDIEARIRDYVTWPTNGAVIDLGMSEGDGWSWSFRLARADHPDVWRSLRVVPESGNPRFTIRVEADGQDAVRIQLSLNDRNLRGILGQPVRVVFSDAAGKDLPYSPARLLRVRVPGGLAITPSALLFGAVRANTEAVKTLRFTQDANGPRLESVALPDGRFTSELSADGENQTLAVRFKAGDQLGSMSGDILIKLSDGTTMTIPCLGKVFVPAP